MCKSRLVLVVGLIELNALQLPALGSVAGSEAADSPTVRPRLGINLSGPADWSSDQPFIDVFHLSREWISQKAGAPWGQGPIAE